MLNKKELYKTSEYWVDELQNEIYRQVTDYMKKYNLNQNELAEKWNISKGYVSQILKGNCNFSLKKLVAISLALEKAPVLQYISTDGYYEMEKISIYIEEHMNKPFTINSTSSTTSINHNTPSKCIAINPKPTFIIDKNDELKAA